MLKVMLFSTVMAALMLAPAHAQSPAWIEAKANVPKMKESPSLVNGPRAHLTEAEKLLGHHGPVEIEGILGTDGKLQEARVGRSSMAAAVDEIALVAANASTFTPAKDASGAPLPVVITVPFALSGYKTATGGAGEYRCQQFVRDMDWWRSVNPDRPFSEHELFKMEVGLYIAPILLRGDRSNPDLMRAARADFDKVWAQAIDRCRKDAKTLQMDAIFR